MDRYVRTLDGRIIEGDSAEAQDLLPDGLSGPTATVGIVTFAQEWTDLKTGRHYRVGDFEKFATNDPTSAQLVAELTAQGIIRLP